MNDKNIIHALREIQKSALHIQQATMELLEELQKNNISKDLSDETNEIQAEFDKISRRSLSERIYDLLPGPGDKDMNMTKSEIEERLPDVSSYSIQKPLHDLLAEGRIVRKIRGDANDNRKTAWAYSKISTNEPIVDVKRRTINHYSILNYLPEAKEKALSVSEIADRLDIPKSTARDALKKLSDENLVQSFEGMNEKNQHTELYYKHFHF